MGLRRLTRLLTNRNASASWADAFADSYNVLFGVVLLVVVLWSPLQRASQAPQSTAPFQLEPVWLVIVVSAWVLFFTLSAMSRVGPVALNGPQAQWWLPTLESRTRLLAPVLVVRWVVAMGIGALVGLLLSLGLGTSFWGTAVAGALIMATSVNGLIAEQPSRRESRWTDTIVVIVPLVGAACAIAGVPAPSVNNAVIIGAVLLSLLSAVWTGYRAWLALPRIHDGDIARSAQTASQLSSAMLQLNTRELSHAFERPPRRSSTVSFSFSTLRGPSAAIFSADAVRLLRSLRHVAQIAVAVAGVVIVVSLTSYSPVTATMAIGAFGYLAALATAEGARRAQRSPILDSLLPMSARGARAARFMVPVAVMAVIAPIMLMVLGVRVGNMASFAVLGLASAPAWAGSVLRAAYRESKQLSGAIIPTPMGAFPADAWQVFATGADLAMLALLPTWVAVLLSAPAWQLVAAQAACSALAVWIVIRSASKR